MQKLILLGASNLTLSFPRILAGLRAGLTGPLDVSAALGHGRSYGITSRVLFRSLPGIVESLLWERIATAGSGERPPLALITDVGNDLVYDVPVARIIEWLEVCLTRLSEHSAQTMMTLLPLESLERLSLLRYTVMRTVLFPGRGSRLSVMLDRSRELNARMRTLAGAFGVRVVEQPGAWYGYDPIHILRARRGEAWSHILSHWSGFETPGVLRNPPPAARLRMHLTPPAERRLFGITGRREQPALEWKGVTVSIY